MASAFEDVLAILALPVVEFAKRFVSENLGKADDGIERRAKLMAHVREEVGLGEIRRFRLLPLSFGPFHAHFRETTQQVAFDDVANAHQ